jgi:hypothetical protein
MPQRGHFYFGQLGHYHFGITVFKKILKKELQKGWSLVALTPSCQR